MISATSTARSLRSRRSAAASATAPSERPATRAAPRRRIPYQPTSPATQHQAEDDQALRELLDGDDQCERQSGEEQQQRSGCRELSAGHSIISRR